MSQATDNSKVVIAGGLNVTGTINGSIAATNGVISGSSQITGFETTGRGIISGSSQLGGIYETTGRGIISGAAQLTGYETTGRGIISGAAQLTNYETTGRGIISGAAQLTNYETTGRGIISGSSQLGGIYETTGRGIISGAAQLTGYETTGRGIISGSSQIVSLLPTGTVSGSSQVIGILGSLNSYTASNDTKWATLAGQTGSFVTTGSNTFIGTQTISGSLNVSGTINATNFVGNGSGITGVIAEIAQAVTVTSSFTDQSSIAVSHNFDTKNVIISVYNTSDDQIIPKSVTLTNNNTATITLSSAQSGYIVVAKGGHVVSGSLSGQADIDTKFTAIGLVTASLNSKTGSYATTGSNTFSGSQIISGSLAVTGSMGVGTSGSGVVGEIRATGDIIAFYSSDERLKENIQPIENALSKVEAISGKTYDWKPGFEKLHSHIGNDVGVIAQEVEKVLPQAVTDRDTGYKAVNYEKIVPLLIEAIKELSEKIKELQNK
jgi:hypothetical protein